MFARDEDEADRWLREHDPYYTFRGKGKMDRFTHPYETPEMEKRRKEMEIPLSCLSLAQMKQIGGEIKDVAYKEGYNFEL